MSGDSDNGLPPRYSLPWRTTFEQRAIAAIGPDAEVLDVGCGATPSIPPQQRPAACRYVALDISAIELEAAPTGSYDEIWVRDAAEPVPELRDRFDLIVSWHAFEHLTPLEQALDHLRSYLRPGGTLVAMLSGAFAAFALANRLVPDRIGHALLERLTARDPRTVFHSYYDRCWYCALEELLARWSQVEIVPHYRGAEYFNFSPLLRKLYVRYEDWAAAGDHRNLATHYLLDAVR